MMIRPIVIGIPKGKWGSGLHFLKYDPQDLSKDIRKLVKESNSLHLREF